MGRDHSQRIIVELEHFLETERVKPADLQALMVGLGPGSYTGLRVGVAVAKGLARGLNIPLVGKPSIESMAFRYLKEHETAVVTLDARRGQVYFAVYHKEAGQLKQLGTIAKAPKADILARHPGLKLYEASLPDALYLAREVKSGSQALEPIYL